MDLVGQKIAGGLQKQLINRTIQHPETKKYLNTSETREVNVMDKFFRITDGLTVAEVRAGATEPKFLSTNSPMPIAAVFHPSFVNIIAL